MRIELICTGNELLCGDIVDTNASWLAQQLVEKGYKLSYKVTVADAMQELIDVFVERSKKADVIIINGGLGPTVDDLSAAAAAAALAEPLVLFPSWLSEMQTKFASMGRTMTENNKKQAYLPQSAEIIDNPKGTACGFTIRLNHCVLAFTPGVPREFYSMIKASIIPLIAEMAKGQDAHHVPSFHIKRYLCFGIGEAALATRLNSVSLPEGVEFGYRAAMPFLEVKLFIEQSVVNEALIASVEQQIHPFMVVKDGNSLSFAVHQLLLERAEKARQQRQSMFKFATVESCTGGLVASQLVDYAGSSAYLNRGLVVYSNQAKQQLAAVDPAVIQAHGAVSIETAEQMAQGALQQWKLDLTVAITGIAGPDGGTVDKPVGMVAFALATPTACHSQLLFLPNRGRNQIRQTATAIALDMVRRYLQGIRIITEYPSFAGQRR